MTEKDGSSSQPSCARNYPDLPIAIITANIQDEIIARARAIDISFVAKPVTAEGLQGFISGAALRLRSPRDDRRGASRSANSSAMRSPRSSISASAARGINLRKMVGHEVSPVGAVDRGRQPASRRAPDQRARARASSSRFARIFRAPFPGARC
jgi:hypothetical protein